MLRKLSERIVGSAIRRNIISSKYEEIYVYKLERNLIELSNLLILFIGAYFLNLFIYSVLYIVAHGMIRRHTGGYHADTKLKCFLMYVVYSYIGIRVALLLDDFGFSTVAGTVIWIISFIIIYYYSPVGCPNKSFNSSHYLAMRKKAFINLLLLSAISVTFLLVFDMSTEAAVITVASFFQTLTLLPFINKDEFLYKKEGL